MATIRLIPSTYYLSNSQYLSVSNAANMYHNTDNTSYATVTNSRSSTTSYYIYLRGFNFDSVDDAWVVNSITIKVKGYESGLSTTTSFPRLYNGTAGVSASTAASQTFGTSTKTITVPYTGDWATLKSYGSNLGIRCCVRRASSDTTGYLYLQGAEIEVDYTIPTPRTVTTTLSGSGTIDPSGTQTMYDGDEFELVIEPTNSSDTVTATRNGSDITSQLVYHAGGETTGSNVLGSYSLVSGGFNGSGASYFQGIVGRGHDTSTTTTSNYYSSSSGTNAVFQYDVSFEGIPGNATIKSLYMMANGHAESTSNNNEYMCVQLKSGNTALSERYNFKSAGTSNSTQTIQATTLPTVAQLESLVVECTLGYYGGAINGVTVYLTYEVDSVYYTYTTTISADMTIAITIGGSTETPKIYFKDNGSWVESTAVYKKVNGSWVLQSDVTTVFNSNVNYVRGSV